MAHTHEPVGEGIIKTDRKGRFRYSKEFKQQILEAFEQSGLSGMQFSQRCGVKYTTFANWVQKRRKENTKPSDKQSLTDDPTFLLAEVEQPQTTGALKVILPGGLEARAHSREDIALLAAC